MPFLSSNRPEIRNRPWNNRKDNHYSSGHRHDSFDVPALRQTSISSSNSSGSSPPNSSNEQQLLHSNSNSNYHSNNEMKKSSDTRIFRGAEILRNQIVQGSFQDDKDIMHLHHRSSGSQEVEDPALEIVGYHDDSDASSDDWSEPRPPPPQPERTQTSSRSRDTTTRTHPWAPPPSTDPPRHQFGFGVTADSSAAKQQWTHYISDTDTEDEAELNVVDDDSDDSTTAVLARATQLLGGKAETSNDSSSRVVDQPERTGTPQAVPKLHDTSTVPTQQQPYLVRRVNELETSTFDSSSQLGSATLFPYLNCASYLPKNLLDSSSDNHCTMDLLVAAPQEKAEQPQRQSPPADISSPPDQEEWGWLEETQEREDELQHRQEQIQSSEEWQQGDSRSMASWPEAQHAEPDPCDSIVPPSSSAYRKLARDPGFLHAQRAGILWQSIVSQHVRFPTQWWNGARSPPMGLGTPRPWRHVGRHRVRDNPFLQRVVRTRGSAGRLLLHIIIRDIMTGEPLLDLAVGCFHPNARGIRMSSTSDPGLEICRDIWLALRPRSDDVSAIESLLENDREAEDSPLGDKRAINNDNLRFVFGESPPVHTILPTESELYEIFSRRLDGSIPPAAILLEEYLAEW